MSVKRRALVLAAAVCMLPAVAAGCATGGAAEGPSERCYNLRTGHGFLVSQDTYEFY